MSVKIRLKRMGRRNKPFFRVVVQDGRKATTGRFLETIGWYDPNKTGTNYEVKLDRVDHWVGNGAQLSHTVGNLVKEARLGKKAPKKEAAPAPVKEETAAPAEEAAPAAEETAETPAEA